MTLKTWQDSKNETMVTIQIINSFYGNIIIKSNVNSSYDNINQSTGSTLSAESILRDIY